MVELAKKLGTLVAVNLIFWGLCYGVDNMTNGRTFFGKKKKAKDRTYVDWKGNVHLGPNDGWVV